MIMNSPKTNEEVEKPPQEIEVTKRQSSDPVTSKYKDVVSFVWGWELCDGGATAMGLRNPILLMTRGYCSLGWATKEGCLISGWGFLARCQLSFQVRGWDLSIFIVWTATYSLGKNGLALSPVPSPFHNGSFLDISHIMTHWRWAHQIWVSQFTPWWDKVFAAGPSDIQKLHSKRKKPSRVGEVLKSKRLRASEIPDKCHCRRL